TQPTWVRATKWAILLGVAVVLYGSGFFFFLGVGLPFLGILSTFLYPWKTHGWTALGAGGTTWMPDARSKQSARQDSTAAHTMLRSAFTMKPTGSRAERANYFLHAKVGLVISAFRVPPR